MNFFQRKNQAYKPIVYGSISFWLGKKAEEQHSHKWVCYVRGINNEDLSYLFEKVVFHLHPSFKVPIRTVTSHPFEIHESGWGEFEILIKIYFKEDIKQPLEIFHNLKLYHSQPTSSHSTRKPVVSEFYDEIIFLNPSEKLMNLLDQGPKLLDGMDVEYKKEEDENRDKDMYEKDGNEFKEIKNTLGINLSVYYTKFEDKTQKQALEDACAYVTCEIESLQEKITKIDAEIFKLQNKSKESRPEMTQNPILQALLYLEYDFSVIFLSHKIFMNNNQCSLDAQIHHPYLKYLIFQKQFILQSHKQGCVLNNVLMYCHIMSI